jgi:hypothetical protein
VGESPILNARQAAEYINRPLNFVRRTLRYELPVVQHGERGPLFFYRTDLDRWLRENTRVPVA